MSLTLRTLLAYLDHTLDPADEANLREKVQTSTIASALVNRIRGVLRTRSVSAPAPDAAAPNDDANTVAEYLDSTLAPELTADIERRCLESDAHLAEVAASHQVLAAALAEPSTVSGDLRRRIYDLKPASYGDGVTQSGNGSSSGLAEPVAPVGPADSGVSNATTRLSDEPDLNETLAAASKSIRKNRRAEKRASEAVAIAGASTANQARAGSRTRQELEAIEPLLAGGRPSRVVPWLVTLALAASFLFVLTKAFRPMLDNKRVAEQNQSELEAQKAGGGTGDDSEVTLVPTERPTERPAKSPSGTGTKPTPAEPNSDGPTPVATPPVTPPSLSGDAAKDVTPEEMTPEDGAAEVDGVVEVEKPNAAQSTASESPAIEETTNSQGPPTLFDPASLLDNVSQSNSDEVAEPVASESPRVIGGVQSHGGLLLTQRVDPQTGLGQWERIEPEAEIQNGQVIYCPPAFQSRLILDGGVELTLIGPVSLRVDRKQELEGRLGLTVDNGRLTVMAAREPTSIWMATPVGTGFVELASPGATAAIEVKHRRLPGRSIEHSSWKTDLMIDSVSGRVQLRLHDDADPGNDAVVKLGVGQQLRQTFGQSPEVRNVVGPPNWIDSGSSDSSLAEPKTQLARMINGDQPVELALIRAVDFRDIRVAGLAARTLANMGVVYQLFGTADDVGPTGLLNQPQHRSNWPQLVNALQQLFDRGEATAEAVAYAANLREGEMDAAKIVRMLQGFTQEELDSGDAAILVAFLDDPKLAVRVMAIEILRQITGETLDYKPEVETANQRRAAVNRWKNYVREDRVKYRKDL